jgi:hypothetical protein
LRLYIHKIYGRDAVELVGDVVKSIILQHLLYAVEITRGEMNE